MRFPLFIFLASTTLVSAAESCDPAGSAATAGFAYWNLIIILILGLGLIGLGWFYKKKARRNWKKAYLLTGLILLAWVGFRFYEESLYKTHIHANFKVFIDGKELDFAKPEFMTESKEDRSRKVHLHDLNGGVAHVHYPGITWQDFFQSLQMPLAEHCLDLGTGKTCSLRFFVNGNEIQDLAQTEIRDLDKVLITNSQNVQEQLAAIADDACVYSNKCPERGVPKGMEEKGGCAVS